MQIRKAEILVAVSTLVRKVDKEIKDCQEVVDDHSDFILLDDEFVAEMAVEMNKPPLREGWRISMGKTIEFYTIRMKELKVEKMILNLLGNPKMETIFPIYMVKWDELRLSCCDLVEQCVRDGIHLEGRYLELCRKTVEFREGLMKFKTLLGKYAIIDKLDF